jgi:hypothetical protein
VAHSVESKTRQRQRDSSAEGRRKQDRVTDAGPRSEGTGTAVPSGVPAFPAGFQTLGGAITWLVGVAAGTPAIFYAFGYLATLSNVHMLGLDLRDLRYDYLFYMQRGASFLLLLVLQTVPYLLFVSSLLLVILFMFLGLRLLYQRLAMRQPFRSFTGHHGTWQAIAYAGLLLLLALQLSTHLSYPEWMDVSDILHGAGGEGSAGGPIRELILSGNEGLLLDHFTYLANQQVWLGALLLFAWSVSRARRWRVLMTAPFALVFVISPFYLALGYGTLALPVKFREALITDPHPAQTPSASLVKMYLLNQNESVYVLWDPRDRQIRKIKIETPVDFFEDRTLSQILKSSEGAER